MIVLIKQLQFSTYTSPKGNFHSVHVNQDLGIINQQKVGKHGSDKTIEQFSIPPTYLFFLLCHLLLVARACFS